MQLFSYEKFLPFKEAHHSAVQLPILKNEDEVSLLFTNRSNTLGGIVANLRFQAENIKRGRFSC
jgi:hypothetical protein